MANPFVNDFKNVFRQKDNVLEQIIIINVVTFIVFNLSKALIPGGFDMAFGWIALPATWLEFITRPWTLLTYNFTHLGMWHLIMNMLWLWWMGKIFKEFSGTKKFLGTFLMGGLVGGLFFLLSFGLFNVGNAPLIGASAGVMAVVVATATLLPDYQMQLFFIGNVKLKYIALGMFVLTTLIDISSNFGGKIAHVGGAVYGFVYVTGLRAGQPDYSSRLIDFWNRFLQLFKKREPEMKVTYRNPKPQSEKKNATASGNDQQKTDMILDKISKSGYDSLTKAEKDFLFKVSKQ